MEKIEKRQNLLEFIYDIARSKEKRSLCPSLTFEEFKRTPEKELKTGTIVKNIKPAKLFVTQDWISIDRAMRTFNNLRKVPGENTLLPGYYSSVPIDGNGLRQRVLVLGDGHHHALYAWEIGEKIDIYIIGDTLDKKIKGLSTLRQKSGILFRGIV